jgi:hypothetical protein
MMAGYASDEDTPVKHKPKDRGLARTETGMRHLPILQCAALPWQARQRNAGQAIDRARRPSGPYLREAFPRAGEALKRSVSNVLNATRGWGIYMHMRRWSAVEPRW